MKPVDTQNIGDFFSEMAINRDSNLAADPVLEYEQVVRHRQLMEFLSPKQGEKILDVGCGNARDLRYLAHCKTDCTGIDISQGMLDEARRDLEKSGITSIKLEINDVTQLSYADATFDKAFASEVMEHIPEWETGVKNMARVLKPGGTLVLTTPNKWSWYGFDRLILFKYVLRKKEKHPWDVWKSRGELRRAVEAAGLQVTGEATMCFLPGLIIAYKAPRPIKKIMVKLTALLEPALKVLLPGLGYLVAVQARKPG